MNLSLRITFVETHFEIPADDLERSKKFYSGIFGWKFEKFKLPDGMDFLIITTTDEQRNRAVGGRMNETESPTCSDKLYWCKISG